MLQVEGELADRLLVSSVTLPSWPHTDILTSSVVQVLVDRDGNAVSASLSSSSGLKEADKKALDAARAIRYQPIGANGTNQPPVATLNWGKLIFNWHTIPLPATNPPSQKP